MPPRTCLPDPSSAMSSLSTHRLVSASRAVPFAAVGLCSRRFIRWRSRLVLGFSLGRDRRIRFKVKADRWGALTRTCRSDARKGRRANGPRLRPCPVMPPVTPTCCGLRPRDTNLLCPTSCDGAAQSPAEANRVICGCGPYARQGGSTTILMRFWPCGCRKDLTWTWNRGRLYTQSTKACAVKYPDGGCVGARDTRQCGRGFHETFVAGAWLPTNVPGCVVLKPRTEPRFCPGLF